MNWYPGHMKKTYETLKENLKIVDLVIIILDARVPHSSLNPKLDELILNKEKIYILNKSDIADKKINQGWIEHFRNKKNNVVENNSTTNKKNNKIYDEIALVEKKVKEKYKKKGFKQKFLRILIVGVPNTGKSTFINYLTKRKSAKTGNKPGVTKGKQWIKIKNKYEILDTPGVLWPNLKEDKIKYNLAIAGLIKDNIIDDEKLAICLLKFLKDSYPRLIKNKYNIIIKEEDSPYNILEKISAEKNFYLKDKEIDYDRASKIVLKDFRNGNLGRISLEKPDEG